METTTKKLAITLVVLLAAAGAFYIYQHFKAEKLPPPKLAIMVGAPIARGAAASAKPALPAAGPKKPGTTAAAAPEMRMSVGPEKTFTYSSLGKRDPFMNPLEVPKLYPPVPPNARPIERVPAESLVVKAIIWNEKGFRALVVTPDGRGYTVKVGDAIGNKQGRIVKISETRVYVTEHVRDVLGNVEANNIVLQLHKEAD